MSLSRSSLRRIAALAALVIAPAPAAPQAAMAVERRSPARVSVDAGNQVTLIFRLKNSAARLQRVQGELALPVGWRLVFGDSSSTIAAGGTDLRLLVVLIPPAAQAGDYRVHYRLLSPLNAHAEDSLTVNVAERRRGE